MKSYYTLIFGIIWTIFCIVFSYIYLREDLKFINKNNISKTIGIVDSTYYVGSGGGEALTIRVRYKVDKKFFYVSAKSMFYFNFEKLLGKEAPILYLKRNPSESVINTFKERGMPLILITLFTSLGIFIILKSEGLAKYRELG